MVKTKNSRKMLTLACLLIGLSLSWVIVSPQASGAQLGGFIKKRVKEAVTPADSSSSGSAAAVTYNDRVLELTDETLVKLENTLVCMKNADADKSAREEKYQSCQMETMMAPDIMQMLQNIGSTPQAAQQTMQKVEAMVEKKCGKNPNKLPRSEESCATANGLTGTQFSIAKERILPFCSSGGQQKAGQYIYSATEVKSIKPKCDKLSKLIE